MTAPLRSGTPDSGAVLCHAGVMNVEQRIRDAWSSADRDHPGSTIRFFESLCDEDPADPTRLFELASVYDWAAREADAIPVYERAIAGGFDADRDRRARIQYGSSLRNVGRPDDAIAVLEEAHRRYPESNAVDCFLALALSDAGRTTDAVAAALRANIRDGGNDVDEYRRALARYLADLGSP